MKNKIIYLFLLFSLIAKFAHAGWYIETIENNTDVGKYSSIAIDNNDNPHITYYISTSSSIKYTKWNGATWEEAQYIAQNIMNPLLSLTLDSTGYPHIIYKAEPNLKYARFNGILWENDIIDSNINSTFVSPTIAIDHNNVCHVTYYQQSLGYRYLKGNNTSWDKTTISGPDGEQIGYQISLVLDNNNIPRVSFRSGNSTQYAYGWWTFETVWSLSSPYFTGCIPSIALSPDNTIHIVFDDTNPPLQYQPGGFKYTYKNGSNWSQPQFIAASDGSIYEPLPFLVSDSTGNLHLMYSRNNNISYWKWDKIQWSTQSVSGLYAHNISLKVDSKNRPHISYYDPINQDLKYATFCLFPSTPTDFEGVSISTFQILWTWKDNDLGEDGYRIKDSTQNTIVDLLPNTTQYYETNLQANTSYYRYVQSYIGRNEVNSNVSLVYTLANPPNNLTKLATTDTTIYLSWTGSDATRYGIERATDSTGMWNLIQDWSSAIATTTCTDTGLNSDTTYWYRIKGYNNDQKINNNSASNEISVITGPPAVTGFSGTALSTSSIIWTWDNNAETEEGYRILTATSGVLKTLTANGTYWIETNLSENTTVSRVVSVYNSFGETYSNNITTYTLVGIPFNLTTPAKTLTTIQLDWEGSGTRYAIERATDNTGVWNVIITWNDSISSATYTDTSLSPGTTYWYRIKAYNGNGIINPVPSAEISARTIPSAPSIVYVLTLSTGTLHFSWNAVAGVDGYTVLDGSFNIISGNLSTVTTFWIDSTGLLPNSRYDRYIRAYNESGQSASSVSTVYTLADTPGNLTSGTKTVSTIQLNWTGNGTRYAVYRSPDAGDNPGIWSKIYAWGDNINTTTITDTPLSSGTTYWYKIGSYNNAGIENSKTSAIISARTVPAASSGFTGRALSTSSILWQWDDTYGEDEYFVKDNSGTVLKYLPANTTYWMENNLMSNTLYTRGLIAGNISGNSSSLYISSYTLTDIPSALVSPSQTLTSITLTWTGNGTRYKVERASGQAVIWTKVKDWSDNIGSGNYTDLGLTRSTTYWYRIFSYNGDGIINPSASNPEPFMTKIDITVPPGIPSRPMDQGIYSSTSVVTFFWIENISDPDSEIIGYYLQVGTSIGSENIFGADIGKVSSYTVSGCLEGTTYYARIKAKNQGGLYGAWSELSDGILIDLTFPDSPTVLSTSHPDNSTVYAEDDVSFVLTPPVDLSGIVGFYYIFSGSSMAIPSLSSGIFTTGNTLLFTDVADGTWYLCSVVKDGAGNIGKTPVIYKINIKKNITPEQAGIFQISDGTKVEVEQGTFSEPITIDISVPETNTVPAIPHGSGIKGTGITRDVNISNKNATINKDIAITLKYSDADISGMDKTKLMLAYYDDVEKYWIVIKNSISYPIENKVKALVNHFSFFRIVEYTSGIISSLSNYPNPFYAGGGRTTKISYSLNADSEGKIMIFDLLGRMVWEKKINKGELPGGVLGPNEIPWEGKDTEGRYVACGGYICVLTAGEKVEKTKIGVK